LLNLDQVGRLIDPTFDPTEAVRQSATQIMRHQMAESVAPGRIFQNLIEIKEFSERLPGRVNRILDAIANNQIQVQVRAFDETKLIGGFHKIANRITLGLILSALVIAAAMLMQVPSTFRLFGYPGLAIIFFGMAALGAVLLAVRILRDDSNRT
jgi:hypothetical protein